MSLIDSRTRLVTLLGYPLGHSLSPLIHNAAFEAQKINMVYLCMPVTSSDFKTAVDGLTAARFVGSNVTIPHKERALGQADELSEQAHAVGALNTLVCRYSSEGNGVHIYGDNTDVQGFTETLETYQTQIKGKEVVVLGSGGAARAVVYALLKHFFPSSMAIVARSVHKAERIAMDLSHFDSNQALKVVELARSASFVRNCVLLVNTTPVGMYPDTGVSPLTSYRNLSEHQIVYDLIYNPRQTLLMKEGRRRGAIVIGGLEMLIRQAAASYAQWTGREMPLELVRDICAGQLH